MLCLVNILHQQLQLQHPGKVIYAGMASLLLKGPLEGQLTPFKARSLRTPFSWFFIRYQKDERSILLVSR